MKQEFSPRRLDLKALARAKGNLSGESPLADFERLKGEAHDLSENPVTWAASGEMRPSEIGGDQVWLHLTARTTLSLVCQRCMRPVDTLIAADRWFRFAPDEASAAALDDEADEDGREDGRQPGFLVLGGPKALGRRRAYAPRHTVADGRLAERSPQGYN